jgi:hypothetical protein
MVKNKKFKFKTEREELAYWVGRNAQQREDYTYLKKRLSKVS